MDFEDILYYIAELYEEDIETVIYNYGFGIYDDLIEQLEDKNNK